MNAPKQILRTQVDDFKNWWKENYTEEEIKDLRTDDPSYPNWDIIEDYFVELLQNDLIKELDKEDQQRLLWLVARNWDMGRMIGWLNELNPLSNLGNLTNIDFLMLAKTLITLVDPEFNDAKSQFASSFKKFNKLTPEIKEILLAYFNDNDEYTKRNALYSLGKLGYPNLLHLIESSWEQIDEEYYKIGCLQMIDIYIQDEQVMNRYLSLAEKVEGEYLKKTVEELRKKNYH